MAYELWIEKLLPNFNGSQNDQITINFRFSIKLTPLPIEF